MNFHSLLIIFALSVLSVLSASPSKKVFRVNITNGEIEGRELTASYSKFGIQTGVVFLGIPHLEPPIGPLRFRKPVKYTKKWEKVLETKEMKAACMSDPVETYKRPEGGPTSEDCFYINVFTNEYCLEHKNCSVMVAIHGGQMTKENPVTFHNDVIVNNFVGQGRNIVVVTLPYRLGVFGLPNWPGDLEGVAERNLIVYDCIEGLEWSRREIANFGGDPNKTTLFGHSGGALIGTVIAFRPEFDHLYQQRIAMSMPTVMHSELANYKLFKKVGELVGCDTSLSADKVFDCMRNVSASELFKAQDHTFHQEPEYISDFVIDGKVLLDHPKRLLERGNFSKKPLMIGSVKYELLLSGYLLDKDGELKIDELVELCQLFGFTGAFENPYEFVDKCVEQYSDKSKVQFLMDHYCFQVPPALLAKHHAIEQPVYLYSNSYPVGPSYSEYSPGANAPVHSEDFVYFMGVHRTSHFNEKDMEIERILTGTVASFVNSGEPRLPEGFPKWEKLDPKRMNYLHIDFSGDEKNLTMPGMVDGFYVEATEFWQETIPKSAGNFSYTTDYPAHFDVFSAHIFSEMKNTVEVPDWKNDKTVEMAKKDIEEIAKFLAEKKRSTAGRKCRWKSLGFQSLMFHELRATEVLNLEFVRFC